MSLPEAEQRELGRDLILSYLFGGTLAAMALAECLAWLFPWLAWIGAYVWILSLAIFSAWAFRCALEIFFTPHRKDGATAFTLAAMLALVVWQCFDNRNGTFESAQEARCILDLLATPTLGFSSRCHAYPAREYYLSILPTLILGTSSVALNLGGALLFILGLSVFAAGVRAYLPPDRPYDWLAASSLAFLFQFSWFRSALFDFEQVIYPCALALAGCGLCFQYLARPQRNMLFLIGINLWHAAFTYPPGIAFSFLLLAFLLLLPLQSGRFRAASWSVMALGAVGLASLAALSPPRVLNTMESELTILERAGLFLQFLIFQHDKTTYLSAPGHVLFVALVLASLLFVFGSGAAVVAAWIVAAFAASVFSQGNWPFRDINLGAVHRTLVAAPVFCALAAWITRWKLRRSLVNGLFLPIWIMLMADGAAGSLAFIEKKKLLAPKALGLRLMEERIPLEGITKIYVPKDALPACQPHVREFLRYYRPALKLKPAHEPFRPGAFYLLQDPSALPDDLQAEVIGLGSYHCAAKRRLTEAYLAVTKGPYTVQPPSEQP